MYCMQSWQLGDNDDIFRATERQDDGFEPAVMFLMGHDWYCSRR